MVNLLYSSSLFFRLFLTVDGTRTIIFENPGWAFIYSRVAAKDTLPSDAVVAAAANSNVGGTGGNVDVDIGGVDVVVVGQLLPVPSTFA